MSLPSSMADFVPCDRLLQKAYCGPASRMQGCSCWQYLKRFIYWDTTEDLLTLKDTIGLLPIRDVSVPGVVCRWELLWRGLYKGVPVYNIYLISINASGPDKVAEISALVI